MQRIIGRTSTAKPITSKRHPVITVSATTQAEFGRVLAAMERGSRIIYHTGFLPADRWHSRPDGLRIHHFANLVYKMYETGKVLLVQRRLPHAFGCEYMAVKL
jgi:hypothetical protein